jgi:prolyl oligopeptidase
MKSIRHARRLTAAATAIAALAVIGPESLFGQLSYPESRKVNHKDNYHGTTVADPYRWLEEADSRETAAWVEAQNLLTFSYLESIPERAYIRQRLTELWDYPRHDTPFKEGGHYFFFKNDGLQNQSVLYKQASLDAEPEILLDPNTLSEDGTVALGGYAFSDDGNLMAYGTATSGSDWREYHVRDVNTGRDFDDHLRWIKFSSASWTRDNKGFFYSRYPEPTEGAALQGVNLDQKVYYHTVGTPQSEDRLIYERPDRAEWGFGVSVTDDGRFAIMDVWHGTDERNRVYYMDLGDPMQPSVEGEVVQLLDDFDATYSFIDNDGPVFYFRTDAEAPSYRVIAIDIERPDRPNWRTVIPEGDDVLQDVTVINGQFVASYLHNAHSQVLFYSMEGDLLGDLVLPTVGTVGSLTGERDDSETFYSFTSYLYPTTIFHYDFTTAKASVFHAPEVNFDTDGYVTRQYFYRTKDGTAIPMFLTHARDIELDGTNPTYMTGYGGFNISRTPRFSISNLVWLEMGGVYAVANLRGGGEYGDAWHKAGMKGNKQNVFDDFTAAAEFLIDQGYTSPEKLSIGGASNGGLLIGAVLNQRPDLFGAALPAVGVMDMLRFHKFTIGWAWVSDYGSSEDPEDFDYLYEYSPYHNLKPGTEYPATMVTTADHDDRVVPGHSFKYAARLQEVQQGSAPTLIRIQTKAGHGSGKPTAMVIEEQADRWAFIVKNLGMEIGRAIP